MQKKIVGFSHSKVEYYFSASSRQLQQISHPSDSVLMTDENVFAAHRKFFAKWKTIVVKAGEANKIQQTVDDVIGQLIELQADRKTTLIGVGGGVVTDLAGYIAAIYMRGIPFGFIPTSLLAMVDASIGGKNGIDVGVYKNMLGTIRQPRFILIDPSFLKTLPDKEWRNGFAEIIKHAAIKDAAMFRQLENRDPGYYRKRNSEMAKLIHRNVLLKTKLVQLDEFEKGDRRLLNFGHTLGHALENLYELSHGQAISIGMVYASKFSQQLNGFKNAERVTALLKKFGLPIDFEFDKEKVIGVLKMDKKKEKDLMNYILLEKIGKAVVKPVPVRDIYQMI